MLFYPVSFQPEGKKTRTFFSPLSTQQYPQMTIKVTKAKATEKATATATTVYLFKAAHGKCKRRRKNLFLRKRNANSLGKTGG